MKNETVTIATTYPCLCGKVRLRAMPAVPIEKYERRCQHGTWIIVRTLLRDRSGVRVDVLEERYKL